MSTTTDFSSSDYEPTSTEADTSAEQDFKNQKRLFWSDGNVTDKDSDELEIPGFNTVESGYLADDESDTDETFSEKIEIKIKKRSSEMSKSSSLFLSDSDGFEERSVL
ncbi:uncharacterized protein CELE_K09C8.8 [Caenorhabditis elegans]|uniref:Uncharacterized protein n=1 Tax=Caenorhabditis elegans TaxID=6239 RepID=Q7YWY2_CAEEL|nr:Uncharacterized protein CELE_K09C8.8 [Caenorhabditis elegans]CAE17870.1 Uncharacterized protein CELE_K09C8.8 [Caenorhabditis elegans]|eukprot:NP_001024777.1 Uncharacterized protein CELE_K09C8.8 [Caenorhabditis elegans]